MDNLKEFIKETHKVAREHGWWDEPKSVGDVISLMHSELSEALEFERQKNNLKDKGINYLRHYSGSMKIDEMQLEKVTEKLSKFGIVFENIPLKSSTPYDNFCNKPDGVLPELADTIIRIFDYVGHLGMEDQFVDILSEKHEYNKTRSYKHGNKTL